jgi:hypothetical protein
MITETYLRFLNEGKIRQELCDNFNIRNWVSTCGPPIAAFLSLSNILLCRNGLKVTLSLVYVRSFCSRFAHVCNLTMRTERTRNSRRALRVVSIANRWGYTTGQFVW